MWKLLLTSCLLCWSCEGLRVSCKDESNNDVDWYIIYKRPDLEDNLGLRYIFINPSGQVTMKENINSPESALAYTLQPIFTPIRGMEPNFGFISYSDQPPGCHANKQFGHSKGVLMVDKTSTGVWLLHSTPQFPYRRNKNNFWPPSGSQNGQIFICATFKYNEFKKIGKHLQYIGAFPYEHDIPDSFHDELKHAVQWTKLPPPTSDFPTLTSVNRATFKAIPKQKSENEEVGDLYYTIAKDLKSDMLVQVWGRQKAESHCEAGKSVLNIKTIKTDWGEWHPRADHSKWCVAKDQNKHWVCIGDVNRCRTQYDRWGGALCVSSNVIQQKFLRFAVEYDNCPSRKRPYPCVPDSHSLDFLNEDNAGVIVDDSEFLNDTETGTHKSPSVMG